jgi:hypothetical protein
MLDIVKYLAVEQGVSPVRHRQIFVLILVEMQVLQDVQLKFTTRLAVLICYLTSIIARVGYAQVAYRQHHRISYEKNSIKSVQRTG